MELFDVLRQIGLVKIPDARFYFASLFLSIEYLHLNNIVYRDLKPENIMYTTKDTKAELKIIDFGFSKLI